MEPSTTKHDIKGMVNSQPPSSVQYPIWQMNIDTLGSLMAIYNDGLVQDCGISSALAMEIPQSCNEP